MKQRIISLRSIKNCRDLGGLMNRDGQRIKRKHLIRSAGLCRAKSKDLERLKKEYGVNLVIDLRTDKETEKEPDTRIEGVEYLHIPIFTEAMLGISHEDDGNIIDHIDSIPDFKDLYRLIVTEESCIRQLKKVLLTIMDHREGAVLWHCSEGKDRCGLVSAFLLFLLGCSEKTVVEDYLMTNLTSLKKAGMYYFLVLVLTRSRKKARKIQGVFMAEEDYLEAALRAIEENYGSLDWYFRQIIDIPDAKIEGFRNYILQSSRTGVS